MGRSARSALLRAFSTERIYRPQKTETAAVRVQLDQARSASASLVTGLKARMSLRRKSKRRSHQEASIQINTDRCGSAFSKVHSHTWRCRSRINVGFTWCRANSDGRFEILNSYFFNLNQLSSKNTFSCALEHCRQCHRPTLRQP